MVNSLVYIALQRRGTGHERLEPTADHQASMRKPLRQKPYPATADEDLLASGRSDSHEQLDRRQRDRRIRHRAPAIDEVERRVLRQRC